MRTTPLARNRAVLTRSLVTRNLGGITALLVAGALFTGLHAWGSQTAPQPPTDTTPTNTRTDTTAPREPAVTTHPPPATAPGRADTGRASADPDDPLLVVPLYPGEDEHTDSDQHRSIPPRLNPRQDEQDDEQDDQDGGHEGGIFDGRDRLLTND